MDLSPEMQMLLTPIPMSEAEKEFRAWIKANKDLLVNRDAYEVAELAILVGFSRDTVYQTLSAFSDAMNGTHIESRARYFPIMQEGRREDARRRYMKWKFLDPIWKDYIANYVTGEAA